MACRSAQIELIYRAYNEAGGSALTMESSQRRGRTTMQILLHNKTALTQRSLKQSRKNIWKTLENDENPDSETEEIVPVDESWTLPVRGKTSVSIEWRRSSRVSA